MNTKAASEVPADSSATQNLLLVEDDTRLALMVRDFLGGSGFNVQTAQSVREAFLALRRRENHFHILVLDLMLPDGDGMELCRRLRNARGEDDLARWAALPILMLTARGDPMDRVLGLEVGADDYLAKPFEPRELLARLRAILRRQSTTTSGDEVLRFGRLELNTASRTLTLSGVRREITAYQFDLLLTMCRHPGRVLTRDFLKLALRGQEIEAFDRTIDVHVSRIRAAIEDDPKEPTRILTVRGNGYVFAREQN